MILNYGVIKQKLINLLFFILIFITFIINFIFPLSKVFADQFLLLQSGSTPRDSGLYDFILTIYYNNFGVNIRVVAVGTGLAINNSRDCNADILIVHDKLEEEKLMEDGYGFSRKSFMFNYFVIVGPKSDPAKIKSVSNVKFAFEKIFNGKFNFISRSDKSGTHKAEERIWEDTGLNPILDKGKWYIQAGQGMGATLNMAVNFNAYIFTDKSNWISFKNKRQHKILFEHDPSLLNNYSVITINNKICPRS